MYIYIYRVNPWYFCRTCPARTGTVERTPQPGVPQPPAVFEAEFPPDPSSGNACSLRGRRGHAWPLQDILFCKAVVHESMIGFTPIYMSIYLSIYLYR